MSLSDYTPIRDACLPGSEWTLRFPESGYPSTITVQSLDAGTLCYVDSSGDVRHMGFGTFCGLYEQAQP